MDTIFATLACYLLLIPFAVAQPQEEKLTVTPTMPSPYLNVTHTTATTLSSSNSTGQIGAISNSTENTTPFTATTRDNETSTDATAAAPESTSRLQTSQSTTNVTSQTNGTSLTATTPGTSLTATTPGTSLTATTPGTPTSTALKTTQTTVGYISTPDVTVITTESSSHTAYTTSESNRTTQGLRLNISEKNMTIVFSVILGVFGLAVVVFMFHKCKYKIQYLHQPLNNTADDFVADDDTLVISGGLYDGHPIYDNVPTPSEDQSQFRLQFIH